MKTLCDKKYLRKLAIEKRSSMAMTDAFKTGCFRIVQNILNSDDFKKAKNIAIYFPIKNEPDITSLLSVKNKNFYFPRCHNNEMEFVKFCGLDKISSDCFNIKTPIGDSIDPSIIDLFYIPALMANYGKGFYDRFFDKYNLSAKKIIVVFDELISDVFIEEKHDFKLDKLISQSFN